MAYANLSIEEIIRPSAPDYLERYHFTIPQLDVFETIAILKNDHLSTPLKDEMLDYHPPTYHHCQRVGYLAFLFGNYMNQQGHRFNLTTLLTGGMLHDSGKLDIGQEILDKPGRLTQAEHDVVRPHAIAGAKRLESIFPYPIPDIARYHHQRSSIPEVGIVQLADISDALMSSRAYKKPLDHHTTRMIIEDDADKGKVDPELAFHFLDFLDRSRRPHHQGMNHPSGYLLQKENNGYLPDFQHT